MWLHNKRSCLQQCYQNQAPAANPDEPAADPASNGADWRYPHPQRRPLSFPVPGDGTVQSMATSLFTGCDQHEARFVLQVMSMWPDLSDEHRNWAYQRLNVYCIVASLGWPAATAACAASAASVLGSFSSTEHCHPFGS